MKINWYEEPDQAHKGISHAVDFISPCKSGVDIIKCSHPRTMCDVLIIVTLNYEGQSLVPSLNPSIASLQHTCAILQSFLCCYSFYKHLPSTYYR